MPAEFESEKPDHQQKDTKNWHQKTKTKPHPNTGSQNAAKNNNKTKPPNTLLSSQTTPAGRATRPAAFGRLLAPRTSKDPTEMGFPSGMPPRSPD
jgi:hypothetical protein